MRNPLLMARLAALLPGTEVTATNAVGIGGDDMEAFAFAWLAWRTLATRKMYLRHWRKPRRYWGLFPANP